MRHSTDSDAGKMPKITRFFPNAHKTSNLWEFVFEQTVQTNSMNRPTQKSGPENAHMIENGAFMGGQL